MNLTSLLPTSNSVDRFDVRTAERVDAAANSSDRESKIAGVAGEFEGMFMSILLNEMRKTLNEGMFPGEGSDTLGGIFDMYMGQHMANSGGIGIRKYLVAKYAAHQPTGDVKSHGTT